MKDCGLIRMDESGRIAVPAEYRKVLKIGNDRLLELYIEKDKLIITKYSPLKNIDTFAGRVCVAAGDATGEICLVCDREKVIACSSEALKDIRGKKILAAALSLIDGGSPMLLNSEEGGKIFDVCENFEFSYRSLAALPIDFEDSAAGCIMLVSDEKGKVFTDFEMTVLKLSRELLISVISRE